MYFSEDAYLIYTLALVAALATLYGIYEIIVNRGFIKNDGAEPSSNIYGGLSYMLLGVVFWVGTVLTWVILFMIPATIFGVIGLIRFVRGVLQVIRLK